MAKADLEFAQSAYDQAMHHAHAAVRSGYYVRAIAFAIEAWNYVDRMMQYEKKYEDATFKSVPCVDIVLKYAPLVFDIEALDKLSELLKERKTVERLTSDDLGERLRVARGYLRSSYRLWDYIERHPGVMQSDLREQLGGEQDEWRLIAERWESMGLLRRVPEVGSYRLFAVTNMHQRSEGMCPKCGLIEIGRKGDLLAERNCPGCGERCVLVIQCQT